jgi:hypothetical protein
MPKELRTAEEFRNAEPGTYVVTGEASAEMARQVARQLERKKFRQFYDTRTHARQTAYCVRCWILARFDLEARNRRPLL